MQAGRGRPVIPNGTIVIVKDAIPNDSQDFKFNVQNNPLYNQPGFLRWMTMLIQHYPTARLSVSHLECGLATELSLPMAGWDFTNLACVDPTSNTTVSGSVATINLASSETVTCTYTNTKRGHLIVQKTTLPTGDTTSSQLTRAALGQLPMAVLAQSQMLRTRIMKLPPALTR